MGDIHFSGQLGDLGERREWGGQKSRRKRHSICVASRGKN